MMQTGGQYHNLGAVDEHHLDADPYHISSSTLTWLTQRGSPSVAAWLSKDGPSFVTYFGLHGLLHAPYILFLPFPNLRDWPYGRCLLATPTRNTPSLSLDERQRFSSTA